MTKRKIIPTLSIVAALVGLFLISGMFWADILDALIFDATGEYRTDGIFRVLSPALFHANKFLSWGWFYGIPLFLFGVAGILTTQPRSDSSEGLFQRHRFGLAAVGVAAIAHVLVLAFSVQFFFVSAGAEIRPMGWAAMMFLIAICTFAIAVPTGAIAIKKERPRYFGILGLVLGFTPIGFALFLLNFAARIKGFDLSP